MNKQDPSPELQEELEREARISAGITHERPIDREEEYFNSHGVALYNGYIGGALSDTAKRIHQQCALPNNSEILKAAKFCSMDKKDGHQLGFIEGAKFMRDEFGVRSGKSEGMISVEEHESQMKEYDAFVLKTLLNPSISPKSKITLYNTFKFKTNL